MSDKKVTSNRPWLHKEVIDWFENILRPEWHVLETGAGGSTVFFAEHCARVTTYEHNAEWAGRVAEEIVKRGLERKCDLIWSPTYPTTGFGNSLSQVDLCFVDGRGRVKSMVEAIKFIRPGGWLVLDDSARERYNPGKLVADYASSYKSVFSLGAEDETTVWQISA